MSDKIFVLICRVARDESLSSNKVDIIICSNQYLPSMANSAQSFPFGASCWFGFITAYKNVSE